jgi:hypothetical protein
MGSGQSIIDQKSQCKAMPTANGPTEGARGYGAST